MKIKHLFFSISCFYLPFICPAQSPFEEFKKRSNEKYIQWQKNLGKDISILNGTDSPYSKKIDIKSTDITIWGIVIGVSSYTDMQSLKYANDDAYKVYSFLKSPEGGEVKDGNIKLLIDEDATKANILASVKEVVSKADSNDVVFFYFSGHGLKGSFIPFDYGKQTWGKKGLVRDTNNIVKHTELASLFSSSKAKHKLCFADACHSGSLTMNQKSAVSMNSYYKSLEETKGGLALFTSSKTEEISLEHKGVRQGVFSHYLIDGLYGKADSNEDYVVTIAELYDYVSIHVKNYTNYQQSPTISGAFDPLMPVALIKK